MDKLEGRIENWWFVYSTNKSLEVNRGTLYTDEKWEANKEATWSLEALDSPRWTSSGIVETPRLLRMNSQNDLGSTHRCQYRVLSLEDGAPIVKNSTSFQSLITVQCVIYDTFYDAWRELRHTLSAAPICCTHKSLWCLFAIMLTFCQITDSLMLWQNYHKIMKDDILHRKRH